MIVAMLVAAGCIVASVTFLLIDTDFWQHLAVGRAIWERREIPHQHLWSWLSYGKADVLPSWGFRALVWPFYALGGVPGLFVWRWVTTLTIFGFLWATARRMGARGLLPLVVLVWCALVYRQRSQVRPETLACVLMAIELWILEARRHGSRDRILWLIPIAWIWVNVHLSYFLAFGLLGIHIVASTLGRLVGRGRGGVAGSQPRPGRLWIVGLAMAALAFLNPFGWQALWQPFDYALHLSREPIFRGIGELQPVQWGTNLRNGLWLMVVGWPLLILLRIRRHGLDWAEALTCAAATAYAIPSQRFLNVYAVAAAPYLSRALQAQAERWRWPAWTSRPGARAALAALACVAIGIAEWRRPVLKPGIGVETRRAPIAACDFVARHGIRGRGFSPFNFAGYQLWRFWPERERLPFMDIHQTGTPEDRKVFADVLIDPSHWPELRDRYRLDYAILDRRELGSDHIVEALDADTTWALIFLDDVAALFVRREGRLKAQADSFAYRHLAAGAVRGEALAGRWAADSALRAAARPELERAAGESRWNATLEVQLANLALADGNFAEARGRLERALAANPKATGAHQRLGMVALWEKRPRDTLAEFEREQRLNGPRPQLELGMGMALEMAGEAEPARRHYLRALERDPGNRLARARLEELAGKSR